MTKNKNPSIKINKTQLIWACENNMSDVALALIATGESNPGRINSDGFTALIWACYNKMSDVALALIATGKSNPSHIRNRTYPYHIKFGLQSISALEFACKNEMSEVALAIISTNKLPSEQINKVFRHCLYTEMSDVALALIATGHLIQPIFNDHNFSGTYLTVVCQNNLSEVAMALIMTGKSHPKFTNMDGENALFYACKNKMENVAFVLVAIGVSKPDFNNDYESNQFLNHILNKYRMTEFIAASANTGLTDIDFNEINDYVKLETQNAGKAKTKKGLFKGLFKGKPMRLHKSRKNKLQ